MNDSQVLSGPRDLQPGDNTGFPIQADTSNHSSSVERVVICPPSWEKLEAVLSTGDISPDLENGHGIAYQRILDACASFENPPRFFSSHSKDFGGLEILEKVPEWMHIAKEVSIGGRRQVLEDGNKQMNK
jgi:hypothetical protein